MHPPTSPIRYGVRVLTIGLCVTAAVAIWALIVGRFDRTSGLVLLTALTAALCTLAGLAGSTALRLEDGGKWAGQLAIGLSQLTLMLALTLIWIPDANESDVLWRALGVTSVLTLAGAHASLLVSKPSRIDSRAIRRLSQGAIACSTSAALLFSAVLVLNYDSSSFDIWRILGVLVVLAVLNTLLVPLVRKIARDGQDPNISHGFEKQLDTKS